MKRGLRSINTVFGEEQRPSSSVCESLRGSQEAADFYHHMAYGYNTDSTVVYLVKSPLI